MKFTTQVITLIMMMCWALQSAAQPTRAAVIVAQVQSGQNVKTKKEYAMGVCRGVYQYDPTYDSYGRGNNYLSVSAILNIGGGAKYWSMRDIPDYVKSENIQVIRQPKHGKLEYEAFREDGLPGKGYGDYIYTPEQGYLGNDKAIFKLDVNGKIFKVVYIFKVVHESRVVNDDPSMYCASITWKISSTSPDGTPVFSNDVSYLSNTGDYTITPADFTGYAYLPPSITFRDLTGAAIGETVGEPA